MARSHVADGGGRHQIWREAANILNNQSRTTVKLVGWAEGLRTPRRKENLHVTKCYTGTKREEVAG
jgi:hypothetical protein